MSEINLTELKSKNISELLALGAEELEDIQMDIFERLDRVSDDDRREELETIQEKIEEALYELEEKQRCGADIQNETQTGEAGVIGHLRSVEEANISSGHVRSIEKAGHLSNVADGGLDKSEKSTKLYREGINENNYRKIKKAAYMGNEAALIYLGNLHRDEKGAKFDPIKAVQYYRYAMEKGSLSGSYYLGVCYIKGLGVGIDLNMATSFFESAAVKGHSLSMYRLGKMAEEDGNTNKALEWYDKAGKAGSCLAYLAMGDLYRDGKGVGQNLKVAEVYFKKGLELAKENNQKKYIVVAESRLRNLAKIK